MDPSLMPHAGLLDVQGTYGTLVPITGYIIVGPAFPSNCQNDEVVHIVEKLDYTDHRKSVSVALRPL